MINNEWEFLIRGNPSALWSISQLCRSCYFYIYEEIGHFDYSTDDFRMKTVFCNNETDYEITWQIGYELVGLFNGAACLCDSSFQKIEIESLLYKGHKEKWCCNKELIGLLGEPSCLTQEKIKSELNISTYSDIRFWLISMATKHIDIYYILKYFNMNPNWDTYYKLMETLESFEPKFKINKDERTSFTNTANNFSLSKFDSRHGFKNVAKENKSSKMSLDDAHIFIRKITKDYIALKHGVKKQPTAVVNDSWWDD
ncbi:MAG: hypothetical protein WCK96_18240 [Methylococcales bacterium]